MGIQDSFILPMLTIKRTRLVDSSAFISKRWVLICYPTRSLISRQKKIPFQTKTSSLIKPDGTVNSVNNWADLNAKIAELDVNNDGFNDFVFTVGRITEYSQTIWINTGDGKFLPATDLYLNTDINWILPEHIADSDSDGLIEFWFAYQLISEPTFRIEVVEITDFRNDSIFGTLPVERHLPGF